MSNLFRIFVKQKLTNSKKMKQEMKKIIITQGLPASGKSTWAKDMCRKNNDFLRVNKDDIRAMLSLPFSTELEKTVLKIRNTVIEEAMNKGKSVIVDDTNLNPVHINDISKMVALHNTYFNDYYQVEVKYFDVALKEAIRRDSERTGSAHVGKDVIEKMFNNYIRNNKCSNYEIHPPIVYPEKDDMLPRVVLVDIDGTIARMSPERSPYEWNKVGLDTPISDVISTINVLCDEGHVNPIYISGRDGSCEKETRKWLRKNNVISSGYKHVLFMRKAGDMRSDEIVKEEIYYEQIHGKFDVMAVFDDRQRVVDMWRKKLGLTVFQVDYGKF